MHHYYRTVAVLMLWPFLAPAAGVALTAPAPQEFRQEIPRGLRESAWFAGHPVQLVTLGPRGAICCYATNQWFIQKDGAWMPAFVAPPASSQEFQYPGLNGPVGVPVPPSEVIQILSSPAANFVLTAKSILRQTGVSFAPLPWPDSDRIHQAALSADGVLHVASSGGIRRLVSEGKWEDVEARDDLGRIWTAQSVLGIAFDSAGSLWFATKAGVACQNGHAWKFYEGKDGLPWNDFTCVAASPRGEVWFGTRLGAIYFDGKEWGYRQGPRWLPNDHIQQITADSDGTVWIGTAGGVVAIERKGFSLEKKAEHYETEIEKYVKRTPYGFVAEASLRKPADRSSADSQDSDNDGLWTAMYGAGECFAYAATGLDISKQRARKAFEALRFLQKVTQGGSHEPPKGYVARTIRPIEWPDPNAGRLERDLEDQKHDRLWKAYEPRWPRSADGKWYWKSDTSSDELDGHFFFYPLYFEFCADTDAEKERVREVVRDLTDHLITHDFALVDHDGKPTRWGVYGPKALNSDPDWWQERGLKSLSMLSYLAVAEFVCGDAKYGRIAQELIDKHGYAQNAMHPKVQHGPGSGNQSDDEMAFMCFYNLLRYSKNERLKDSMRVSFYRYWVNEAPERNPFFNFAYAAHCQNARGNTPFGEFPLAPWEGWQADAMDTLYGMPLDRLNWPSQNSHRLDVVALPKVQSGDITEPEAGRQRGFLTNGKVLPVQNRHFGHWNTDPWRLNYGGNADELAAGTVFLLPYYMGLYHGFIERP